MGPHGAVTVIYMKGELNQPPFFACGADAADLLPLCAARMELEQCAVRVRHKKTPDPSLTYNV